MGRPIRVAVAGFSHEANTFAPVAATYEQWERAGILTGEEIREAYATSAATLAGYFAAEAEDPDLELVPLSYARITPMGASTADAYERLTGPMVERLVAGGPWDGVLLPLHGAAVADGCPDADGEFVRRVRAALGSDVPIGVSLDMHANVSALLVEQADVVTVYQTNPHLDADVQGRATARLLLRQLRGEIAPTMALADPPLVVNILRQGTAEEPMAGLLRLARGQETRPGVLSVSVVEGFPYADVPEMGMSFLAVTDGDPALAAEVAGRLAAAAWERRESLTGDAHGVDEALRHAADAAAAGAAGPVVLLDMGDNVGGGSPGDSTILLHAARRLGVGGIAQIVCDLEVVAACAAAGPGGRVAARVGGKTDDRHGDPFPVEGTVTAVCDGRFEDPTPTHGGVRFFDMGPTAGLRTDDGFSLVLTSRSEGTHSQQQFRLVGFDPVTTPIVVAKGVHSPRAGFEPIAAELVWVATPGSTSADLSTFSYRRRRRPMFPFEPDATW